MTLQEAQDLALEKMSLHGLTTKGWTFSFNDANSYVGICYYSNKEIRLSRLYAQHASPEYVLDTILHEIAHALVGAGYGHGQVWRNKAREIGVQDISSTCTKEERSEQHKQALMSKVKYVVTISGGEVVSFYRRRPNKNTVATMHTRYMPKRRAETEGKLVLEAYTASKHNIEHLF